MTLVVDTSIAVKWVITEPATPTEPGTEQALALLDQPLIAPDFLAIEFANVLWKRHRRGEASTNQTLEALRILPDLLMLRPTTPYLEPALTLATTLDHPVYDCLFLACAIAHNTQLITADHRFATKATSINPSLPITLLPNG